MFQVYHSNDLSILKDLLLNLSQARPLADPFAPETILVQSPGMAQWLKLELADSSGIAANIDFPLPATFLWRTFVDVLPDVPERSAFNKEAMSWKLMQILPELLSQEIFEPLAHYLADDPDQFRLYQLSGKIADIFDQYMVYRPEWIADWEQGGNESAEGQLWQPVLWRALAERTAELEQSHWHRANMFGAFASNLPKAASRGKLPERLFVFGISALPQNYLQALQMLGQFCDVHLMVMNPCQYYWGDIVDQKFLAKLKESWLERPGISPEEYFDHGNPLLASMGKLGRDYLFQIQQLSVEGEGEDIQAFVEPEANSLLSSVQRDILQLRDAGELADPAEGLESSLHKTLLEPEDQSIRLQLCHSPLREVEVLHDQLLAMFEQQPELKPRDVIVMMPDVAAYAPFIETVFGNAAEQRYIPYSISDRSSQQEHPLLLGFCRLLRLADSRFSLSEVLELLEVPATMRRLKLDQNGFEQLRHWLDQVQVRWGIDSQQRESLALPAFDQNSWRTGLRRMFAGYSMGDIGELWQGIAPYGEVQGLNARLLGVLTEFVDLLEQAASDFQGERPVDEWIMLINGWLEALYQADESDEVALDQIRRTLEQLHTQLSDARFQQPLSAAIVIDYLSGSLQRSRSSQRFMVGQVNFCTLMPMRSIPFRVVCLLGMNDGVYPRSLDPAGFDLIARAPRKGDRSRRDDDRYLFLEALLSAKELFYISYVARSIQDNTHRVPSVLVSELMEYCSQSYVLPEHQQLPADKSAEKLLQKLSTEHPLMPYSERYFDQQNPKLFSYADEWLSQSESPVAPTSFVGAPLSVDAFDEIELEQLLRFYRHPSRYFFQQRLKVFFYDELLSSEDAEPFELDKLSDYQLKQRYLQRALDGGSLTELTEQIRAEGLLPFGIAGQRHVEKLAKDCREMADKLEPVLDPNPLRHEVRIPLTAADGSTVMLLGWLDQIHQRRQLRYRPAQLKGHDYVAAWICHLAFCASGGEQTLLYGLSGHCRLRPVPQKIAVEQLNLLLAGYIQGLGEPMAFMPNSGCKLLLEPDPDKAEKACRTTFSGNERFAGEGGDPYIHRICPDFDSFWPPLQTLANSWFGMMTDYLEERGEEG